MSKQVRTGHVLATVPDFLLNSEVHLAIVEDRGPITKLLPALEAGFSSIITADDDHTYGPGWADGLVSWHARLPNSVVCYRGRLFDESREYNKSKVITRVHRNADFITSVSGVIYDSSFFDNSIFKEWKQWKMNDDIIVSSHLKKHGIPIEVVPFPQGCHIERLPSHYINSLCNINRTKGRNDKGLKKVYW